MKESIIPLFMLKQAVTKFEYSHHKKYDDEKQEIKKNSAICRQRGVVVRSVVFTTTMIARLMVHLPT